jgi:hypothetical protein
MEIGFIRLRPARNDMNEGYCFDDSTVFLVPARAPMFLPIRGTLAGASAQQNSPVKSPGHHSKSQNNFPGAFAPFSSGTGVYHGFSDTAKQESGKQVKGNISDKKSAKR